MSSEHTGRKLHIGGEMVARNWDQGGAERHTSVNMIAEKPTD